MRTYYTVSDLTVSYQSNMGRSGTVRADTGNYLYGIILIFLTLVPLCFLPVSYSTVLVVPKGF